MGCNACNAGHHYSHQRVFPPNGMGSVALSLGRAQANLSARGLARASSNIGRLRNAYGDWVAANIIRSIAMAYVNVGYSPQAATAQVTADLDGVADVIAYSQQHAANQRQPVPSTGTGVNPLPPYGAPTSPPATTDACGRRNMAPCGPAALCSVSLKGIYAVETSVLTTGVADDSNGEIATQARGTDIASLQQLGTFEDEARRIVAGQPSVDTTTALQTSAGAALTFIHAALPTDYDYLGLYAQISSPGTDSLPGSISLTFKTRVATGIVADAVDRTAKSSLSLPQQVSVFLPLGKRNIDSDAAGVFRTGRQTANDVELEISGLPTGYTAFTALLAPGSDAWDYLWSSVYNFGLVSQ
jgi:hypothetical protein